MTSATPSASGERCVTTGCVSRMQNKEGGEGGYMKEALCKLRFKSWSIIMKKTSSPVLLLQNGKKTSAVKFLFKPVFSGRKRKYIK